MIFDIQVIFALVKFCSNSELAIVLIACKK